MIETRPKVSIIIPVYNSAKHLRECLDSVVHQTLNDIEIIVVYDKSEDDSWDILLEYASFESVRIIESVTKQGPGGARNIGIASASADYLGFCDSDDIVEPTMFEKMYKQAVEADADMVVVKTSRFTDNPTNPIKVSQWPDKLTKLNSYIGLTLEYLETHGVPVIGMGTDDMPAFYTQKSGFKVDYKVDTPEELANFFKTHLELGLKGGILVGNPIPDEYSMDPDVINPAIDAAIEECKKLGIKGKATTPFLLAKVKDITGGDSLDSNIHLVYNNAKIAALTAANL